LSWELRTQNQPERAQVDATEKLVIALRRAKVINGAAMVTMLGRYFEETRDVRPVR
jgi:hypothetical protein